MEVGSESAPNDIEGNKQQRSVTNSNLNLDLVEFPTLKSNGGNIVNPRTDMGFSESGNLRVGTDNWCINLFPNKKSNQDNPMVYQSPTLMEGKEAVSISSGILQEKVKECEELAIGYFVGRKLSFSMVKEAIAKVWKTKAEVSITLHSSNSFVFKFLNTDDRNLALDFGAFYIGSNLFVVRPWSPFIETSIAEMKSIPVWIMIYNVPLHLWNNLGLSPIASFVGKPLMMDDCTINKTRLSYARVLVEISFDCQYPNLIPLWVDGKFVMNLPVEYQWKPQKCLVCHSFGHSNNKCYLKKANAGKAHWNSKKKPNLVERIKTLSKEGETGSTGIENREQVKENSIVDSPATTDKEVTVPHQREETSGVGFQSRIDTTNGNVRVVVEQDLTSQPVNVRDMIGKVVSATVIENGVNVLPDDSSLRISNGNGMGVGGVPEVLSPKSNKEWSCYKRTKSSGRKKYGHNAYLNPFTVLESEPESGFDDSNDELPDKIDEDSRVGIGIDRTIVDDNSEKTIQEDELDKEIQVNMEEMGPGVDKLKLVEDVSHFKPMNREQHLKKLKNFSNLLGVSQGEKENAVDNIFEGIVDRHRSTKSDKEIAKLAWNGAPSTEKLGRGKRTPVKKKY